MVALKVTARSVPLAAANQHNNQHGHVLHQLPAGCDRALRQKFGSVNANIPGPWYNLGQLISLTVTNNDGYLFYAWQGVDSQTGNTAPTDHERL